MNWDNLTEEEKMVQQQLYFLGVMDERVEQYINKLNNK